MLSEGETAPDFELPGVSDASNGVGSFDLAAGVADGPLLVNFYVFDFHPACTEHVCSLHDLEWFDVDLDRTVYAIGADGAYSHHAFARSEHVNVPLLSDSGAHVAGAYDVALEEYEGHRARANRAVFVVDRDRVIRYAWAADSPAQQPPLEAAKDVIDGLTA